MVVDESTGKTVLRMKAEVAARKGLAGLGNTNFEVVVDATTGQKVIRMKDDGSNQMSGKRVEVVTDAVTGKQTIRMVFDDDNDEPNERKLDYFQLIYCLIYFLCKAIVTVTENDIDLGDFERVIDPKTGREVLRMKAEALKSKGLEELGDAEFEIVVDSTTGQSRIVLKTSASDVAGGTNTKFEIVVDAVTGKQKIIKQTVVEQDNGNLFINLI